MNTPDLTLPVQLSLMDELRLSCRKLFLRRHEVQAHIGAHDFEKGVSQRLWIDVELWVPFERSTPALDSLHEVVDYDFVRAVRLSTCKPDVYPDCEAVGVEVFHVKPA